MPLLTSPPHILRGSAATIVCFGLKAFHLYPVFHKDLVRGFCRNVPYAPRFAACDKCEVNLLPKQFTTHRTFEIYRKNEYDEQMQLCRMLAAVYLVPEGPMRDGAKPKISWDWQTDKHL